MNGTGSPQQIVVTPTKSMGMAIILTAIFGPLGMFYSTIVGGIIMFLVSIGVLIFTAGLGFLFTWPICIIWAAVAVKSHNDAVRSGAIRD